MFIPFNNMPGSSRIWIYQCNRELTNYEIGEIKNLAGNFVNEWTAHQQTLHASFEILHRIFLVLAVDENKNDASGCSIDKSVYFVRQIEKQFNVSFFDRMAVAFRTGEKIQVKPLNDFLEWYKKEKLSDDLHVFNNLVVTKQEMNTKWEIPLKESWITNKV
ncbi:MAG: ABC transporter ATPase [Bacteroidia bacterium]